MKTNLPTSPSSTTSTSTPAASTSTPAAATGKTQPPAKNPRCGVVNEFLWLCAGVDRNVLRQCPSDHAKYAGIGGTILFTALMAMFSGGYALTFVFGIWWVGVVFGIFWGCLIFNLDRFIVNTMYSDGKVTISWQEIKSGMPRIILAIFLGIVISYPLELKIFDDEISVKIEEMKADRLRAYIEADQTRVDSLEQVVTTMEDTPAQIFAGSVVGGNLRLNELMTEKNNEDAQARNERSTLANLRERRAKLQAANTDGINDAAIGKINGQISEHQRTLNQHNAKIRNITGQMGALSEQVQELIRKQEAQKLENIGRVRNEIEQLKQKNLSILF